MTLTAIDQDEGLNGQVVYRVLSVQSPPSQTTARPQLFAVGETSGVVSVNASLIGYPGVHNLTIVAFDSAAEPRNASAGVTVIVEDVNTNTPTFVVPDETVVNTTTRTIPNVTVDEVSDFMLCVR